MEFHVSPSKSWPPMENIPDRFVDPDVRFLFLPMGPEDRKKARAYAQTDAHTLMLYAHKQYSAYVYRHDVFVCVLRCMRISCDSIEHTYDGGVSVCLCVCIRCYVIYLCSHLSRGKFVFRNSVLTLQLGRLCSARRLKSGSRLGLGTRLSRPQRRPQPDGTPWCTWGSPRMLVGCGSGATPHLCYSKCYDANHT